MALEIEIKTYEEKREELLAHEGKFVVIKGQEIVGFFDTYADALQAAYGKFHSEPFFVKKIQAVEQVQFVARV